MNPGQIFCVVLIFLFAVSFYALYAIKDMAPGMLMMAGVSALGSLCGFVARIIVDVLKG